jgi:hypothetical protein
MEAMMKWTPYLAALFLAASLQPVRADVLDGLIFGAKCMGAADPKACEEQAKREADETRERMRQQPPSGMNRDVATGSAANGTESRTDQVIRNWVTNLVCYDYAKRSAQDVDTSYARLMSRYSFMTRGEMRRLPGNEEGLAHVAGYLHQITPGSLYRLEQVVHSPDVANGRRQYKPSRYTQPIASGFRST